MAEIELMPVGMLSGFKRLGLVTLWTHSQLNLNLKDFISHFVVCLFDGNEGCVIVVCWVKDAAAPVDVFRFVFYYFIHENDKRLLTHFCTHVPLHTYLRWQVLCIHEDYA